MDQHQLFLLRWLPVITAGTALAVFGVVSVWRRTRRRPPIWVLLSMTYLIGNVVWMCWSVFGR
jgi:hypothetical protein